MVQQYDFLHIIRGASAPFEAALPADHSALLDQRRRGMARTLDLFSGPV